MLYEKALPRYKLDAIGISYWSEFNKLGNKEYISRSTYIDSINRCVDKFLLLKKDDYEKERK